MKKDIIAPVEIPDTVAVPVTPPKSAPNLKLVTIIVVVLLLAAGGVVAAKFLAVDPKKTLADAFKKTTEAKSFSFAAQSDDGKFVLDGDVHEDQTKLSQVKLTLNDLDNKRDEDVTFGMKFNNNDLFFDMSYAKIDKIIGELSAFSYMKTYQLVYPVLKGQKAVHVSIPEVKELAGETKPAATPGDDKTVKQIEEFGGKLQAAVIIRKFDRSSDYKGQKYQRITIGLDKEKLIAALESLKDMDLDVKISQINAMIKVVKAVNNWDSDLVEVYIQEGRVAVVVVSAPEIPESALKEGLEESTKDNPSIGAILKNSTGKIESLFKPKTPGQLTKLGTLELTNYNSAPLVQKPAAAVEFNDVLESGKVEVLPVILPLIGQSMGIPATPQVPNIPSQNPYNEYLPQNFKLPLVPVEE